MGRRTFIDRARDVTILLLKDLSPPIEQEGQTEPKRYPLARSEPRSLATPSGTSARSWAAESPGTTLERMYKTLCMVWLRGRQRRTVE